MEAGDADRAHTDNGNRQVTRIGALEIESGALDERWLIEVRGEVDLASIDTLEAELKKRRSWPLVLDLSGVEFMDGSGVRVLLQTAGRISLGGVSAPVARLLRLCGVEAEFRYTAEARDPAAQAV